MLARASLSCRTLGIWQYRHTRLPVIRLQDGRSQLQIIRVPGSQREAAFDMFVCSWVSVPKTRNHQRKMPD